MYVICIKINYFDLITTRGFKNRAKGQDIFKSETLMRNTLLLKSFELRIRDYLISTTVDSEFSRAFGDNFDLS